MGVPGTEECSRESFFPYDIPISVLLSFPPDSSLLGRADYLRHDFALTKRSEIEIQSYHYSSPFAVASANFSSVAFRLFT